MLDTQINKTNDIESKNTAVSNWLAERSQVIVMYCRLSGFRNQTKLPENEQINGFCDVLIDYVSAGHFEVYQQIANDCEINGPTSIQLLNQLYPDISKTTDVVVDFNEKYSKMIASEGELMMRFDQDLSILGEAIAKRVDLEDNLIDTLRTNH